MSAIRNIINQLKDPKKEIALVRKGLKPTLVESFLEEEQSDLVIKDILVRLDIPSSTYFAKRKAHKSLDPSSSEKFLRLFSVMITATALLGKEEAKSWLYRKIPSLGNEAPIDLLDTEVGHRLVAQVLLQVQYGVYS